jgi:hypothetical protein
MKTTAAPQHKPGASGAKSPGARRPFFAANVQARMQFGRPGDRFEVEADGVADRVVDRGGAGAGGLSLASSVTPFAQRREAEAVDVEERDDVVQAKDDEEPPEIQARAMPGEEERQEREDEGKGSVQARSVGAGVSANAGFAREVRASRGGGDPLPARVRERMDARFGADFSSVRVHTDAGAVDLAETISAQAFTHGGDIFFNDVRFAPESRDGEHLLAHELTHTIQQGAVRPIPSEPATAANADVAEVEAEAPGTEAAEAGAPAEGARGSSDTIPAETAPDVDELEEAAEPPPPDPFAEQLPEPDLTLPDRDMGPAEVVATVQQVDLSGSSEDAATSFIDATPSLMAATQPAFAPAVEGAMQTEQRDLAEHPPVLELKTSGVVDVPITPADQIPVPGEFQLADAPAAAGSGDLSVVSAATPDPFRGNAEQERELEEEDSGSFWDAFMNFVRGFTSRIRTRDDRIDTSAGERPTVKMDGDANSAEMTKSRDEATAELKVQRDACTDAFRNHPGQSRVQPKQLDEERAVAVSAEAAVAVDPLVDANAADYAAAPLPQNVRDAADLRVTKTLTPNLAAARGQVVEAAAARDQDKAREIDTAQQQAARLNAETDTAQRKLVVDNRTEIAKLQGEGVKGAYDQVDCFTLEAAMQETQARADITEHVKTEEGRARTELDRAEDDARREKEEAERMAEVEKKKAEEAQKKRSWWDRAKGAIKGAVKWVTDKIDKAFNWAREQVAKIINKAKNLVIGWINAARDWVVDKINKVRNWAKEQVNKYLKDTFPGLAKRINDGIDAVADKAVEGVNYVADKAVAAVTALADGLARVLDSILAKFQAGLKMAVRVIGAVMQGDFLEALRAIIEGACEIAGVDPKPVFEFLDRAGQAIKSILKDPVKYVKLLFGAVGDGIVNFFKHIKTHMIDGVIGWLTGAFAEVQLTGPFEFSPKGILSIVLQVLGLTYASIKAKVIKKLPAAARVFDLVEKGYALVVRVIDEGPGALWEELKGRIGSLKDTVMGAIRNFLIIKVIKEGVIWLLSLTNPASAIVKVVKLVFDLVMFLVERYQQIKDFIISVYEAVAAVAAGNFTKVTVAVENALVRVIPVLISLIASVLGLGGIAKQVKGVIETIAKPIHRAIDWVVDKIVAFAWKIIAKAKAKAKTVAQKIKAFFWPSKTFAADGETHKIYFVKKGTRQVCYVRSTPTALADFVKAWEASAGSNITPAKKAQLAVAKGLVPQIAVLGDEISALEQAKKPVPAGKLQHMLSLENELATCLRTLLGSDDDIAAAVERYKLEGMTATYATVPKPKGDYLTGDHQPQAAAIIHLSERPYFQAPFGVKIRQRAAGKHADNAYVINLQDARHKAGRTWGPKGNATKNAFITSVQAMESKLKAGDGRRSEAVKLLKTELKEDVSEMRDVYKRPPKDDVWKDLDKFAKTPQAKSKLVEQIRQQVSRGEDIIAAQPMNELAS